MDRQVTSTLEFGTWDEQPFGQTEHGPKLTRATATRKYHGDIEGEGTVEYLMAYHGDEATFVGIEIVTGILGGRTGSFAVKHDGVFEADTAKAALTIVPGAASGQLAGLTGAGQFVWPHGGTGSVTLDYRFEEEFR